MLPLFNTEVAATSRAVRAAGLELRRRSPYWVLHNPEADLFQGIRFRRVGDADVGGNFRHARACTLLSAELYRSVTHRF
jgi:hypothetical protein